MAFIKYEVPTPVTVDVKIGKLGITITNAALEKHGLGDATHVNLLWDAESSSVGVMASDAKDKSSFTIKPRGRHGREKLIAAGKFFTHFSIDPEVQEPTDGILVDRDGVTAFVLSDGKSEPETKTYTGKPRGRQKKVAEQSEEISGE